MNKVQNSSMFDLSVFNSIHKSQFQKATPTDKFRRVALTQKCYLVFAVVSFAGYGGSDGGAGGTYAGGRRLNARRYELEGRRNKSIAALAATVVLGLILHDKEINYFPRATGESPGIPSTRVAERRRSNIA